VEAAAEHFTNRRRLDLPLPEGTHAAFMREAADVHRELFEEHAESYGENVRLKLERCLAVTDADYERAVAARERYRERLHEVASEVDLLLSPTLVCVAPPVGQDELVLRDTLTRLTFPFNAAGWPALAQPCGAADDGLPASVQLAAPPGQDARVLAAGAALERALSLD
jgi:aspartyl-tRNA(Asn)/glutamyl-tRNA(Gln) amidotransferase subunit A